MATGFLTPLRRLAALIAIVVTGGAQGSAARLAEMPPPTVAGAASVSGAPVTVAVTPPTSTVLAGRAQRYSVQAFDAYGNAVGSTGASPRLAIEPDGTCHGLVCMARRPGPHTVTARFGAAYANAVLNVTSRAPKLTLKLRPGDAVTIDLRTGRGRLRAACPAPRGELCRVSGQLVTPVGERLNIVGMLSGRVPAGGAGQLLIELTRSALGRLQQRGSLTAIGALRVIDLSGRASIVVTLTLRPAGHA